jgi:hypothetical protein
MIDEELGSAQLHHLSILNHLSAILSRRDAAVRICRDRIEARGAEFNSATTSQSSKKLFEKPGCHPRESGDPSPTPLGFPLPRE